jgi:predicted MPP superfamily phosphohydrolase|tara:strand:- start:120 stop:422 length:303 start_codon:yes stop_codon:yes gene_type:complete
MTETLSLISILSTIELKLNGALAVSNNPKNFNDQISELDKLLEALNALIIEKNNEHQFTDEEKELLKKIFNLLIKVEKINKNKLGFFDSLNKYFYDNVNK